MIRLSRTYFAAWMIVSAHGLLAQGSSQAGTVTYTDLKNKKATLPYGESFTITGNISDVQLTGRSLDTLLKVQSVAGDYTVSDGSKGTIAPSAVTGTTWQVTIGKLPSDSSATFNFQFTGLPSPQVQTDAAVKMFGSKAYAAAVSQFESAAVGKSAADQLAAMQLLAQAVTDALTSALADKGLTPKSPADLKSALAAAMTNNVEDVYNLGQQYLEMQNPSRNMAAALGLTQTQFAALPMDQFYAKLKDTSHPPDYSKTAADQPTRDAVSNAAGLFVQRYDSVMSALQTVLNAAAFNGSASLATGDDQQTDITADLKKYAGFDVGALYSYRLSELRTFAMVHVYFGPVNAKPDAPAPKPGAGEWMRERLSLAFGMALKDVSGASKTKITSQDAFIYGLGFRVNKYFRISAGGMLYRATLPAANGATSPANGALRQEVFVGPSIDVTAISALQSIFSKTKSN